MHLRCLCWNSVLRRSRIFRCFERNSCAKAWSSDTFRTLTALSTSYRRDAEKPSMAGLTRMKTSGKLQGVKSAARPRPTSTFAELEQANSLLFSNILSHILNDPGKPSYPFRRTLCTSSKARPFRISVIASSFHRLKLPILQASLQHAKWPKVTKASAWRARLVQHSG
jgi:hypothetical protein